MKASTVEKLCCPYDKRDLDLKALVKDETGDIIEGWLYCNLCRRIYPIVKGIPIMSPDEFRDFKFEQPLLEKWKPYLQEAYGKFPFKELKGF